MFPTRASVIITPAVRVVYPQRCNQAAITALVHRSSWSHRRMLPLSLSVLCFAPSSGGAGRTPAVASRAAVSLITLPWRAKGKKDSDRDLYLNFVQISHRMDFPLRGWF